MSQGLETVSDEELARQTQAGSLASFEKLVYRYEGRIYRFVLNSCRNDADAREVTQDSFVRAFQAIAQFNSDRNFGAWLFTIARRKCIDHHRALRPRSSEPLPELPDHVDPAVVLTEKEDHQNLWTTARRLLSPAQFEALWLRYAEEMTVSQIAEVLHKTETGVKVLLFRARETLGREMESKTTRESTGGNRAGELNAMATAPAKNAVPRIERKFV